MSEKKRILFVDDSRSILNALHRMLHSMKDVWDMGFVNGGQEALDCMRETPYHVVISDMCMPGMDGGELLSAISKEFPQAVRVALTGADSKDALFQSAKSCHRILSKPCSSQELKDCITSAGSISDLMSNEKLQKLTSRLDGLPSMDSSYVELMDVIESEEASIKDIADIICKDVGMSVKILHLVNSAYFGMSQQVSDVPQAIALLGIDPIKSLVLVTKIFTKFDDISIPNFSIKKLWNHSYTVGRCANLIAKKEKVLPKRLDLYTIAGVVHDLGVLIFASQLPEDYKQVLELNIKEGVPICQAEKMILGATHGQIGAYLLGLWGFNSDIVDAVLNHHNTSVKNLQGMNVQIVVYIANALAQKLDVANNSFEYDTSVDYDYLASIGLEENIEEYECLCFSESL